MNGFENAMEKMRKWVRDPANLTLLGIIAFALLIRIYFLVVTKGQPLWWDEAEYGSIGKFFAGIVPEFILNPQRPFMYPAFLSVLYFLNLSEILVKFISVVLPSTLIVFAAYLLGKEMYGKVEGLIAAFLTSVCWTFLFWSARLQPDFFSVAFQVLAVVFIWKYWKNKNVKLIIYSAIFASLGYQFKVSGLLVPMGFFVFMLFKDGINLFKKKDYWIFFLTFMIVLIPQIVYSKIAFGSFFAFLTNSGYSNAIGTATPFAWQVIDYLGILSTPAIGGFWASIGAVTSNPLSFYQFLFFAAFIIGAIIGARFILYADLIIKDEKKRLDPNIFSFVLMAVVGLFYIMYIRSVEDRWVFLWIPFISIFAANGIMWIYWKARKFEKNFAFFLVIAILILGAYSHIQHASQLIDVKKTSYEQVEQAALWIKANSNKSDVIYSTSFPQTAYYSERFARTNVQNENEFKGVIEKQKPRYLQVSAFEGTPDWINKWIGDNQNNLKVVYVDFADKEKKQPLLIIYEIKY